MATFQTGRCVLWLAMSVALAAAPPPQLTRQDFQQLMEAAVKVAGRPSEVQPTTTRICVERELGPALDFSRHWGASQLSVGIADVDRALNVAISRAPLVADHASMPPLPAKFIVIPKAKRPAECVVQSIPVPGQPVDLSTVVLSFTEPALANGYAFIEEYENCPGLCGTTYLRVFRKQHGRWTQIARTILAVS